jgi:hypothetical protein
LVLFSAEERERISEMLPPPFVPLGAPATL